VVSELYMLLSYYLNKSARREPNLTNSEMKSVNLKRNLFVINVVSIALASYFFVRHNDRCEGGSECKEQFFRFQQVSLLFSPRLFSLHVLRAL
jgi:hypothetical protein